MAITKKSLVNSSKATKLTATKTTKISSPVSPAKMATAIKVSKSLATTKMLSTKLI